MIDTLRRECTDHVLVLNEQHLKRVLDDYAEYYNRVRCHLSLEGNSPVHRSRARRPAAEVHGTPVLGGLHHCYRAVA